MKSLTRVQKVARVLYILSRIAFWFCIVGCAMCVCGAICVGVLGDDPEIIRLFAEEGVVYSAKEALCLCIIASVECAVGIAMFVFVNKFYKKELEIGTPFNKDVAKEAKRVGLIRLFLPLGAIIVNAIIVECFHLEIDVSNFVDITLGIVYLIMACVFDYGADVINVKVAQSKANLQSEAVVDVESEE